MPDADIARFRRTVERNLDYPQRLVISLGEYRERIVSRAAVDYDVLQVGIILCEPGAWRGSSCAS